MEKVSDRNKVECWIVGNPQEHQWHHSVLGSTKVIKNEVGFDIFRKIHPTKSYSELTLSEREMVFNELKKL